MVTNTGYLYSLRPLANDKRRLSRYLRATPLNFKKVAVKRFRFLVEEERSSTNVRVSSVGWGDTNDCCKLQAFIQEMRIWADLEHANILPLEGIALVDNLPAFVSEWMVHGTAKDFTSKNFDRINMAALVGLFKQDLVYMLRDVSKRQAIGIANGLSYLHSKNVVHGNMKAVRYNTSLSKSQN